MKAIILAGGFGTRISEESQFRPKPMIELGGKPILWHIMKIFSAYGVNNFIICAGYRQHMIKEYFDNYFLHTSDITFDFTGGRKEITVHSNNADPWRVTIIDTGLNTMTGGRVKRAQKYIGNEPFLLTYGDGVANVNIKDLISFHKKSGKVATITAYNSGQRFGILDVDKDGIVHDFREKNEGDSNLINIGFMVLEPKFFDFIEGDSDILEQGPLKRAADQQQLSAFRHDGYWQCMDTAREKENLERLWSSGKAPWKIWKD